MPSMNIVSILSYLVDFVQWKIAILAGFCNSAKSTFSRLCNIASLFSTGLWIDDKNNGQPRYCISNSSQYTAAKVPSSAGS